MNRRLIPASAAVLAMLSGVGASGTAGHTALVRRQAATAVRQVAAPVRAAHVPAFLEANHAPGIAAPRHPVAGPDGVTNAFYFNWSGYAATGPSGSFTKVSGSWTVSRLASCSGEHQTATEWVGFDGFTNPNVEQAGTISTCFEGKARYYDWYEMYPTEPDIVTEHTVAPGDKVSATVTRRGAAYTLVVIDATHRADSFSATARCSTCQNDSAEWINERDVFAGNGYSPLADYGTWKLTAGAATESGRSSSIGSLPHVDNITMIDATGSYNLATASALVGGNSFTTTWKDSW